MNYLIVLIVGFLLGYLVASKKREISFISKQTGEKERNKEKILELLKTQQSITNNDVEAMLGISDATATRYFDELEKEGKVRQVGKTGRYVNYERV